MSVAARPTPAERAEQAARETGQGDSLTGAASALLEAFKQQAAHVADVAAAELRVAVLSGIGIVGCAALAIAGLLITWMLLVVLAADGLTQLGLPWQLAVLILAAAHLVAVYGLWRGIVRLSGNLGLPRLRRALFTPGPAPDAGRVGG